MSAVVRHSLSAFMYSVSSVLYQQPPSPWNQLQCIFLARIYTFLYISRVRKSLDIICYLTLQHYQHSNLVAKIKENQTNSLRRQRREIEWKNDEERNTSHKNFNHDYCIFCYFVPSQFSCRNTGSSLEITRLARSCLHRLLVLGFCQSWGLCFWLCLF